MRAPLASDPEGLMITGVACKVQLLYWCKMGGNAVKCALGISSRLAQWYSLGKILNNAIALPYPYLLEKNAISAVRTGLEREKTSMIWIIIDKFNFPWIFIFILLSLLKRGSRRRGTFQIAPVFDADMFVARQEQPHTAHDSCFYQHATFVFR